MSTGNLQRFLNIPLGNAAERPRIQSLEHLCCLGLVCKSHLGKWQLFSWKHFLYAVTWHKFPVNMVMASISGDLFQKNSDCIDMLLTIVLLRFWILVFSQYHSVTAQSTIVNCLIQMKAMWIFPHGVLCSVTRKVLFNTPNKLMVFMLAMRKSSLLCDPIKWLQSTAQAEVWVKCSSLAICLVGV